MNGYEKPNCARRFVLEYANYKIGLYERTIKIQKHEDVIKELNSKINEIDRTYHACNRGLITSEEAIRVMANL